MSRRARAPAPRTGSAAVRRVRQAMAAPLEADRRQSIVQRRIAIDWGYLIARRPVVLAHTDRLPPYLLLPEIHHLLRVAKHDQVHFMLGTLWHTGARVSELLSLTPADFLIDSDQWAEVSVHTLKVGRPSRKAPLPRLVPVRDPRYIDQAVRYFTSYRIRRHERIFAITRQAVNARIKRLVEVLLAEGIGFGIPVGPHTFRHSFAVNAVLQGVPLPALQGWLGHRSRQSTEIYTQVLTAETGHLMEWVEF